MRMLLASYANEKHLINALHDLKENHIRVEDVFMPYPIHAVDVLIGIKRSRLPIVCFVAACVGLVMAMGFQMFVFNHSWPMNIGGKPFNAVPAFIPVAFELTVLVGGLVTVFFFFLRSRLYPFKTPKVFCMQATSHEFAVAVKLKDASHDIEQIKSIMVKNHALLVQEKELP